MRTAPLPAVVLRKSLPEQLAFLMFYQPPRGTYDELLVPPDALNRFGDLPGADQCELLATLTQIKNLIASGKLPADDIAWAEDKSGHSIGCELYGFAGGLTLVQQRFATRLPGAGRTRVSLSHYVTDGEQLIRVPHLRIRPACQADPSPSSPLLAVSARLSNAWRERLPVVHKSAVGTFPRTARH